MSFPIRSSSGDRGASRSGTGNHSVAGANYSFENKSGALRLEIVGRERPQGFAPPCFAWKLTAAGILDDKACPPYNSLPPRFLCASNR